MDKTFFSSSAAHGLASWFHCLKNKYGKFFSGSVVYRLPSGCIVS